MNKSTAAWAVLAVVVLGLLTFMLVNDDSADDVDTSTSTQQVAQNDSAEVQQQDNIVELAQATPQLSTLVDAVVAADLVGTLSDENAEYTVFAPTNDAFAALLAELDITAEELLAREDLGDILTYHVVPTAALSSDLSDGQELETVNGQVLTVSIDENGVMINGAMVTTADVDASNGVVHIIDSVLLPS